MPLRILIADDHEGIRRSIRSLLADRADCEVCAEAADGIEATELARQKRPDLVLMDITMPRMDGIEATRIIREQVPETAIIVVSQNDPAVLQQETRRIGAAAWVAKSNLADDLIRTIQDTIALRKHDGARATSSSPSQVFVGGGEMGERIRAFDWSKTPLGPIEQWPQSLRTAVSLCLASNFPINIVWGPEHTQIYNDGYSVCCGDAHPRALGENYRTTWASAWPVIGDSFDRALAGETTYLENQRMFLNRLCGSLEETFFTFSHSPIRDESGGIGGLFHPVTETTGTMLAERRARALSDLSSSLGLAETEAEVARRTVEVLSRYSFDLPFVSYYRLEPDTGNFRLAAHYGAEPGLTAAPAVITADAATPWPFAEALTAGKIVEVYNVASLLQGETCGPYSEPPNQALVIPVIVPAAERPPAVILMGVSSRLPMNDTYRGFFPLVSVTISNALSIVRAREDERRRAEALAEIDRAKTLFFSNVSHEFRTPLTLMLGTLEDALAARDGENPQQRERLEVAHRNSLRLMKLVNTLLDFSRIEAGRIQACYEPTDLATFTAELASVFRSAIERAGLKLLISCPSISESVYVDRQMWEKIVFNLLSNAFKFTFDGEIEVSLRESNGAVELHIRDTGTGIPPQDLPHLFERFYRVEKARGRTFEGSGIGLALVQELVKLHGGSVRAESQLDKGSTFVVTVPVGKAHLPSDRLVAERTQASTGLSGAAYVEEALRWLPGAQNSRDGIPISSLPPELGTSALNLSPAKRARVLIADDNADMREYLQRLLQHHYRVDTVADGQAALSSARATRPDLILSDVMMPRLDGFGLLQTIRSDQTLRNIPVILLSARAGEESRVEGLQAGADDYLVKPFSARELLATVGSHLEIARIREQSERQYKELALTLDLEVRARTQELEQRKADVLAQSEQLRELSWQLLHMQDEERRRIARELHDSAGQTLAVLGMTLASLVEGTKQMPSVAAQSAREAEELVRQLTKEIRTTSYLLHPPLLDENGLPAALSWYISGLSDRSQLDITFQISENFGRLPSDMELAVFRVVQECLTNIHRHSGTKTASIQIGRDTDQISIEVRDQGHGIPPEKLAEIQSKGSGVGIRGIRERLRLFQGEMIIDSNSAGTTVLVTIPLVAGESADNRATSLAVRSAANFNL